MSGSALVTMPGPGGMSVWRVVQGPSMPSAPARRKDWLLRVGILCIGLASTAGAAAVVWDRMAPDTVIRTRILAEGPALASRAALSDVALRLGGSADRTATLQDDGEALVLTARDRDPAKAGERIRSLVDAVLNAPLAAPIQAAAASPAGPGDTLRAERARVATAADAADSRQAAISASLTALTRDVAARTAADRKPGRETLDRGNAALADLELQRLQLVSKYQDTYPAVLALDAQIRNLRVFLIDESRRIEVKPAVDVTDALLSLERDRLRAEMAQVETRRQTIAATLVGLDRQIAALPIDAPVMEAAVVAPPVLVAAAMTSFPGVDERLTAIPAIAAGGLLLSALAALLARRRGARLPAGLVLEQVTTDLVIPGQASRSLRSAGPADDYHGKFISVTAQPHWLSRT